MRAKRPAAIDAVQALMSTLEHSTVAAIEVMDSEVDIRDPKDRPILMAALALDVDLIISGDRHFRELSLEQPRILTPAQFREEFMSENE